MTWNSSSDQPNSGGGRGGANAEPIIVVQRYVCKYITEHDQYRLILLYGVDSALLKHPFSTRKLKFRHVYHPHSDTGNIIFRSLYHMPYTKHSPHTHSRRVVVFKRFLITFILSRDFPSFFRIIIYKR